MRAIGSTRRRLLATHPRVSSFLQTSSGAVLVLTGGMVRVEYTQFESNVNVNLNQTGDGVVNLGGKVHCESPSSIGCLSVCTSCQEIDAGARPGPTPLQSSSSPTPTSQTVVVQPALSPSVWNEPFVQAVIAIASVLALIPTCVVIAVWLKSRRSRRGSRRLGDSNPFYSSSLEMSAESMLNQSLLSGATSQQDPARASLQRRLRSLMASNPSNSSSLEMTVESMLNHSLLSDATSQQDPARPSLQRRLRSLMASSPAPMLLVDQNMTVTLWSSGERL